MMSGGMADVVIFTARDELKKISSEYLKRRGVSNLIFTDTRERCIDALERFAKALLIIDWLTGQGNTISILAANCKLPFGRQRPILLIAEQVTTQIVAVSAEYGVSQIYTDPLNSKSFNARLTSLLISEGAPDELRRVYTDAADLRHGGDIKGALRLLKQNFKKHPTNLRLKCEIAEQHLSLNEPDQALTFLSGMEATKPPYLRGIHLLGRCQMKMGQFDQAHKTLGVAQLFNPQDADRLCDIGQALLQLDRFKEARASFEDALKIEPTHRAAKIGTGQSKMMDGNVNDALGILKEISGDLEIAAIFNTCAVMNMRKGRHDVGMNLYTSALAAVGNSAKLKSRLYFNMGLGYRRWGKRDKAREALETARSFDPNFKKVDAQLKEMDRPKVAPQPSITSDIGYDGITSSDGEGVDLDLGTDFNRLFDNDMEETLFTPNSAHQKNDKEPA